MKFSCEKETLLSLIGTASRAVTGKSAMPLLEGLLVTAEADALTLTGYDLSMGIRTTATVDVLEPGSIVLNARLFYDIVRKLPQDTVFVETDDKLLTTIKCGRAVFNLIATEADEYPALAEVSDETGFSLPQAMLKSMIAQTIFSVSDNESKPIHTGCLFELEGGRLNVIAVDGYRLSVRREAVEGIPTELRFVVPGSSLREIERILSDEPSETVAIYPDRKNILFRMGQTTLITRLIDGEFLNYRAAIPTEFDHEIDADRHELITCIERVSLIVSEKLKNPVRFHFDGSYVQMSCITAVGKSYDECAFEGAIDGLEIGFNNRYVLDALRAAGDDTVRMQLKGPLNPMVIVPREGDKYTYLVLPVRLKAND
ncbi:MAG: DNA polymerase III subunit beta [Eubacteriales bacterium]|nr:DNA polymerase III subunit beta [Eubacteriales bacterium]